jgi:hypothetical protein
MIITFMCVLDQFYQPDIIILDIPHPYGPVIVPAPCDKVSVVSGEPEAKNIPFMSLFSGFYNFVIGQVP